MATATCPRCGIEVRWVSVGDDRIALNRLPQMRPPDRPEMPLYRLQSDDVERAELVTGREDTGYAAHRDVCPG